MSFKPASFIPALGPPRPSAKARVLAQWRGIDMTPLDAVGRPIKTPGEVMKGVMREIRIESRQREAEIVQVWNRLLSPDVVAHAQPVGLAKGTLFVNVDSSVWLEEIVRWRKREILDRLRHSFGRTMIQRISFRIG